MTGFLFLLVLLPLLASAQSSSQQQQQQQQQSAQQSGSQQASQTVITSTSLTTIVGLGPNRQTFTSTSSQIFTTTQILSATPPAGSSNSTASGNSTSSKSSTSSSNLPTAPTDINGGGVGGAPVPGATGHDGRFGPDDSFIAAAAALRRNALLVGVSGVLVGGALVVL